MKPRPLSRRGCARAGANERSGARRSALRSSLRRAALTASIIGCLSPLFVAHVVGHAADPAPCPPINSKTQLPATLSYLVPPGYTDTSRASDAEAYLVAPSIENARESITFVPDDPPTDVTGHTATTIAGLPAFVVTDVAVGGQFGTFERDVVLQCGHGTQFRVDCRGLPGYDPTLMADSCQRFLASLTFQPAVAAGARACPSLPLGRSGVTTIACSVPDGYHVVPLKSTEGIALAAPASGPAQERIDLNASTAATTRDYAGHLRITVGDCPAYVMTSTAATTYAQQVVLDCGTSQRYSIQCQGYLGSSPSHVAQSCASFLASLHTVSVPQSAQGPANVGVASGPLAGVSVGVDLVVGVFVFAMVRLLTWAWPQVFGLELLELIWSSALGRVGFLLIVALSVAGIATQFPVLGDTALAFWTVVVVAVGLELLYRTVGRRLVLVPKRRHQSAPLGPPEPVVSAPPSAPASAWQTAVGYGRRGHALGPQPSAPASVLHPRPSAQLPGRPGRTQRSASAVRAPASMLPARPGALQGSPYGSPADTLAEQTVEASVVFRLLQVVAVVQGVLGVLGGINILRSESGLSALPSVASAITVTRQANNIGIATIVLSALVIVAVVRISRPSPAARAFLVLWEMAAAAASAAILLKYTSPLGLRDALIVVISAAGMEFLHPVLALVIALITLVGILVSRSLREWLSQ